MCGSSFICLFYLFFKMYRIKLVCLLSLEGLMLMCIWNFVILHSTNSGSFSIGLIFLCFLVLDSVVGASLLISMARTGKNSCFFETL